ncbi:fibronectin type III domain-containing protein [Moritella sp. 24]|uniref:fibronectin type III domain-containing protein n=1 Tax=Moritella sp. 24 TaxID=2746230 RepID=UPI001BA5D9B5|nr:fibronectin type III domain-containing protein [Moritella sp. 24]QUM77109.1 fibronectin type III domain-containing protein [Moritella sp. 24]
MYKLLTRTCCICITPLMLGACGDETSNSEAVIPSIPPEIEPEFYNNGMPENMKTDARGLPILHSLPTAKGQLYLDFDGDFDLGEFHTGIDFDGNPDAYNKQEQEYIYNWWVSTAAHFSMFDIDVTTEIDVSRPNSWNTIFPGAKLGVAYGGYGINSNDIAQMTASHGPYSSVVGHEGGHTFGLPHVVGVDAQGKINSSYYGSPYPLRGWHLGSGDRIVNKWSNKFRSDKIDSYFGGVEKVASRIAAYDDNSTGYRPDDHKTDLTLASKMDHIKNIGFVATGIIETMEDSDSFYFDWLGGFASISSHAFELSPVNLHLNLYDNNKQSIAMQNNGINHQWISGELPAGRYYITLQSAKRYSDLGEYRLRVNAVPGDWRTANIGPKRSIHSTTYNSDAKQWTLKTTGGDIWGTKDNFVFIYKKLVGEGQIIAKVDSNNVSHAWAKFGVMIRGGLSENSQQFSQLLTGSNGPATFYRSTIDGSTSHVSSREAAARWIKIERIESINNGSKTGEFNHFKASISLDGINWDIVNEQIINLPDEVYIGLAQSALNQTSMLFSSFSSVKVTGNTKRISNDSLKAPSNLTVNSIEYNEVTLQWDDLAEATDYLIERSEDGLSFVEIAKLSDSIYTDTSVVAGTPYSYRVSALNTQGQSSASTALKVQVRAEGPQDMVAISFNENTIVLDWGEPLSQIGYQVERSTDGASYDVIAEKHADYITNVAKNSHAETQKYIDKDLYSDTQYYYRITTLDAQGKAGYSEANAYTHKGPI